MKGFTVPLALLYDKVKFQIQYFDYTENQWTAPCILTEDRAKKFLDDLSVKKIKILDGNQEWVLDLVEDFKSTDHPIIKPSKK